MAFAMGPDSVLPTIKCSTCGVDIDMMALAEHVCATLAESPKSVHRNGLLNRLAGAGASAAGMGTSGPVPKLGKLNPPPRIDAVSANRSGLEPVLPTSSNYGSAYGSSPLTPNERIKSPGLRSFRGGPPSPPIALGYDSPFPPWPTSSAADTARKANSVKGPEINTPRSPRDVRLDSGFSAGPAPKSPGQDIFKRLNTIAPGPFDPRSQSPKQSPRSPLDTGSRHRRSKTSESIKSLRNQDGANTFKRPSTSHSREPQSSVYAAISNSNPYGSLGLVADDQLHIDEAQEPRQPVPSVASIDRLLDDLSSDDGISTPAPPTRSNTYPDDRRTAFADDGFREPTLPNVSLPDKPSRSQSAREPSRKDKRVADAPPVPVLPNLRTQFPGIGFAQSPTESASSDGSVFSSHSSQSSRSSPPASDVDPWSRRPSDASVRPEYPAAPLHQSGQINTTQALTTESTPPLPHNRQRSRTVNAPPFRKPSRDLETEANFLPPIDPAIQPGIFGYGRRPSEPSASTSNLASSPSRAYRDESIFRPAKPNDDLASAVASLRCNPTTASRAPCRGCGAPIVGKAIKAADGRITGRWHKECFVCKTCQAPFPTGDFYVMDDQPYCDRHYHSLNGSLCGTCDGGIEGQYLETDQGKKYHKLCFTCDVCDIPLRDEYYEVGGKQYCERHAWSVAQRNARLDPGASARGHRAGLGAGASLEKRSTRLMMM